MEAQGSFEDFIRRIRSGDQAAAAELVRQYEQTIRRVVRFRLTDARLGAALDSMDICQSVLGSFFVRAASGQYELTQPEDLVKLLVTMARNKLASQARKEHAARRDNRRVQGVSPEYIAADQATPSEQVANQELLQEVHNRLTPEERRLVDLRSQGLDWAAIALELGEDQVVLRKRLSRALDRVLGQLGMDEAKA